jgi:DNA relaxase NicK
VAKQNLCSVLDASVDWFTGTFKEGLRLQFAEAKAERLLAANQEAGDQRDTVNRYGYSGEKCGAFFFGRNEQGGMAIISGSQASESWAFFAGLSENITRLDLQITLKDDDLERDWTIRAQREFLQTRMGASGYLRSSRIKGTPDGATLYIGRRASARFVRIYDKSAESPGSYPDRSWRWEIEYKAPLALVQASKLLRTGYDAHSITEAITSALQYLGVTVPCDAPPIGWRPRAPKVVRTDEGRVAYTRRVIAPFLKRLGDSVGEDRVKEALADAHPAPYKKAPKYRSRRLN